MTTAYLFPGQGSQTPGMGRAFYEAWPATRARFDDLDAATDADLAGLCFEADAATLRATANAQPATFATAVAAYAGAVERVGPPDYVAGHSLGHLTAAVAAGMLASTDGIDLVRRRGDLMARAARAGGPGTMVAVLLADPDAVADACAAHDGAAVAAYNAPRQTVVSGEQEAVAAVRAAIEERTRARFVDLDVGAAFHSPVMRSAEEPFADAVAGTPLREATTPVCSDVSGEVYTDPTVARRDLPAQLTSPVDWVGVVEALAARGVDRYVEVPPAGALVEFVERIDPGAETVALETPADAEVPA
ncbi:MAG: ACP S-malonyltransferase [Haloferacaceae archaeon]